MEKQVTRAVAAAEVEQGRADKVAYMREYRAGKRTTREALDARGTP